MSGGRWGAAESRLLQGRGEALSVGHTSTMAFLRVLGFFLLGMMARGAEVLVYHDGDRVQGRLVRQEGDVIVFQSPKFGEIRVNAAEVELQTEVAVTPPVAPTPASAPAVAVVAAVPVSTASTPAAADAVQAPRWWHPWTGRLSVALQWLEDTTSNEDLGVDFRLERKWVRDELRFETHYTRKVSSDVLTEDITRGSVYWRHDLPRRFFSLYNPVVEWDKAFKGFAPTIPVVEYVLTQQQLGIGYTLMDTERASLRAGVAENWIGVRLLHPVQGNFTAWFESVFAEAELTLPRGWKLRERGQIYFYRRDPDSRESDRGWDNSVELTKQLTDQFSLTLRHEYRVNRPSLQGADYEKLRLLLGLDF